MAKIVDYSSYCYDELLKKVYAGYNKNADVSGIIFPDWSPNNIRKLLISKSGFVIMYYTTSGMKRDSLFDSYEWNTESFMKCIQSPNYKPMLTILNEPRRCTGLEELLIVGSDLAQVEKLEYLVPKNKRNGTIDINTLQKLYPRLAVISLVNEIPFDRGIFKSYVDFSKLIFADIKSNVFSSNIVNKDYAKKKPNFSATQYYLQDGESGSLSDYFNIEIAKLSSRVKAPITKDTDITQNKSKEVAKPKQVEVSKGLDNRLTIFKNLIKYARLLELRGVASCYEVYNFNLDIGLSGLVSQADVRDYMNKLNSLLDIETYNILKEYEYLRYLGLKKPTETTNCEIKEVELYIDKLIWLGFEVIEVKVRKKYDEVLSYLPIYVKMSAKKINGLKYYSKEERVSTENLCQNSAVLLETVAQVMLSNKTYEYTILHEVWKEKLLAKEVK